MAKHVKRSVLPIYLVGFFWLGYALLFSLRSAGQYLLCAALSGVVFVLGKALFPDRLYDLPGEPEQAKQEPAKDTKEKVQTKAESRQPALSPEVAALIKERDRAVSEMRRLNDNIPDPRLSQQIDHLEEVTGKIVDQVVSQPKKLPQIRRHPRHRRHAQDGDLPHRRCLRCHAPHLQAERQAGPVLLRVRLYL